MDLRNPMELFSFVSGLAPAPVWTGIACKGALVVTLGLLLCGALRRLPAAVRHAVWCATLAGLLALPMLQWTLPAWSVPILPAAAAPPAIPAAAGMAVVALAVPSTSRPPVAPPSLPGIFWLWVGGALLYAGRFLAGAMRLRLLARRAERVDDPAWTSLLRVLGREMGVSRPVVLLRLGAEITPLTWGLWRPVILLPASADLWSAQRQRVVLLHELAHIARHDLLTQGLAGLACALHWFNPLAWYAAHRQRLESERACDDRVLAAGTRASDYAGHLLAIARGLRRDLWSPSALAMARRSQIEDRMLAILTPGRRRPGRLATLAAVAGLGLALVPLAAAQLSTAPAPETVMPAAPGIPPPPTLPAAPSLPNQRLIPPPGQGTPNQGLSFQWTDGASHYSLTSRGDVDYAPDGTDVRRIGNGGQLVVEQRDGNTVRRLAAERDASGNVRRNWSVGGASRPFDAEAGRWLAAALQSFRRLQAGQSEQIRSLVEREAAQRRNLPAFSGAAAGQPASPPPPPAPGAEGDRPLAPPPGEMLKQQKEIGALLSGAGARELAAYLQQEKEFRGRMLQATSRGSILDEELRRAAREKEAGAGGPH